MLLPKAEEAPAGERSVDRLRLGRRLGSTRLHAETPVDAVTEGVHVVEVVAARVDLAGLPLLVADDAVGVPAIVAADGCACAHHRIHLNVGPWVLAVPQVLALKPVEATIAVGVGLIVDRSLTLINDGVKYVVISQSGMVGSPAGDEVHHPVLGDHSMA